MKRLLALAVVMALSGCSNAPVAGFLDCVAPSKTQPGLGVRPPAGGEWAPPVTDPLRSPPPGNTLPPPADVLP